MSTALSYLIGQQVYGPVSLFFYNIGANIKFQYALYIRYKWGEKGMLQVIWAGLKCYQML